MVRTTKKPEERREEIIQAARTLFETKDYDKTTMNDVMTSVGIAKGTIYHYFKSKEDLLAAVIENMVEANLKDIRKNLDQAKGNALEKIRLLVHSLNIAKDNPELFDHLHRPENAGMHIQLLAVSLLKCSPLLADLIEQGCSEKLFQTRYPAESAEFIISAVQFLTDRGIYPWQMDDLQRRAKAFPHLIEQLLQAPPGSFSFMNLGA